MNCLDSWIGTRGPIPFLRACAPVLFLSLLFASCAGLPHFPLAAPKLVVGYVSSWGLYSRNFSVADARVEGLSHLIYAFADVDQAGKIALLDPNADINKRLGPDAGLDFHGNLEQMVIAKRAHPGLRTMISVGGAHASARFAELAADRDARKVFAESVLAFLRHYRLDGVDIDWEGKAHEEALGLPPLLSDLRAVLDAGSTADGTKYLISAALPAGRDTLSRMDLAAIGNLVDFANLMAYNIHGTWEPMAGMSAPLFADPLDPRTAKGWASSRSNIVDLVDLVELKGFPLSRLSLGLPLFGRGWQVDPGLDNPLYAAAHNPPPKGTREAGVYEYDDMRDRAKTVPVFRNEAAGESYLYDKDSGLFISYDDEWSSLQKANFALNRGLGGLMLWELSFDRDARILTRIEGFLASIKSGKGETTR